MGDHAGIVGGECFWKFGTRQESWINETGFPSRLQVNACGSTPNFYQLKYVIFAVFGAMDDWEGVGRSGRPMVRWKGHEVLFQQETFFLSYPLRIMGFKVQTESIFFKELALSPAVG